MIKNILIILCVIFFSIQGFSAESEKNILVLNSYHEGFPWTDGTVAAIKKKFAGIPNVELYFEYLDRKRFTDESYMKLLPEFYLVKYRSKYPDVIIATDDNALDFLRKNERKLFPEIPVVYAGINNQSVPEVLNKKRYTGVIEEPPPDHTINLALKFHPGTKHFYVITDYTPTGRARFRSLEMVRQKYQGITFEYSQETTIDEIKKRLSALREGSIVLLFALFNDSTGKFFNYKDVMSEIYPVTSVPVYTIATNYSGLGVAGGVVNSFEFQGAEAASMVQRILKGESIENIPVIIDSGNRIVLDYRELKRFGVDFSLVPDRSIMLNRPKGFYDFYRENMVLFLLLVCGGFLTAIVILAMSMYKIMKINRARLEVISELQSTLSEVKDLRGLLPICANCKNIRNDRGYWEQIETYIAQHSSATFTHSLCPACVKKLYPGMEEKIKEVIND